MGEKIITLKFKILRANFLAKNETKKEKTSKDLCCFQGNLKLYYQMTKKKETNNMLTFFSSF